MLLFTSYFGRVKLIYIDPPYNTGQDFVYPDNYADPRQTYLQLTGQADAEGNLLTSNPETSDRYHSSWLSMMYPRLFLAASRLAFPALRGVLKAAGTLVRGRSRRGRRIADGWRATGTDLSASLARELYRCTPPEDNAASCR